MKSAPLAAPLAALFLLCSIVMQGEATAAVAPLGAEDLYALTGQPVDIAPWAYEWRADRTVQDTPEACFIPRRLERINKIYRTAREALPPDQLKSIHYNMPDLLEVLPPVPRGNLLAGLLWTGGVAQCQVELHWPEDTREIPAPEDVEVRIYPTSYGWFGWTVDRILSAPEISADQRTWTYKSDPALIMDWAYNNRVEAATEMVAVFYDKEKSSSKTSPAPPVIRITGPGTGMWLRMDVEIEWGFQAGMEKSPFEGRLEPSVAMLGEPEPLERHNGVTIKDGFRWRSRPVGNGARRGICVPLMYAVGARPGLDSRITLWTKKGGVTIRISDLATGPVLIPDQGIFVTQSGSRQTARQFAGELAAANAKSIRQMTREHREAASWEELMREVRLWTCPEGTAVPPFSQVEDPPMEVSLPDSRWTDAWRAASFQLKGKHMWGGLAFEVARVAHDMDLIGLHAEADQVYEHFLASPGVKPDGDYADGDGALEWAKDMRHDMGYSHDGTHASTGRLLFAMAERYFLTGDREWFQPKIERLRAAADWIIRQRTQYMKGVSNRKDLHVAGLMPPCMLGDYAIPSCDWHWYYVDNALALQGLQRFADVLAEFDPKAARNYRKEAEAFREDLQKAIDREAALAPVRRRRDGMFHSYLPRMAYAGGIPGPELGAPQFPDCDKFMGALPLAEPHAALDAGDARMMDTLDMMEEMGTSESAIQTRVKERTDKGLPAEDAWFWNCFVILPKASHNANIYLLQDDIPNFLRFWVNAYASVVGADGKLWEHWHLGNYDPCGAPDNGTAGWFMENFRNLLVMEEGQSLWAARGTPRAWLEQGKKILVRNAPTHFGPFAYEIVSDANNGRITATIEIPSRRTPKAVFLRFRHPGTVPIKSVTVNGQNWRDFDPDKEVIHLHDVGGSVNVTATY